LELSSRTGDKAGSIHKGAHFEIRDLQVKYGEFCALAGVSLDVPPGSVIGLVGPNGSGKTTLINAIMGLQPVAAGGLTLDGRSISSASVPERARIGIARTFQANRLFGSMSVIDNALLGGHRLTRTSLVEAVLCTPRSRRENRTLRGRAEQLFGVFGSRLLPRVNDPAISLSYANRRRLEICRAFMADPVLLMLDEPMAGMNPNETWELAEQLPQLQLLCPTSILLIEHKMEVMTALCSHMYALDHGVCIADGDPTAVQQHPAVAEAFFGVE
jgi:branched-chain amino acid transport system permease protein